MLDSEKPKCEIKEISMSKINSLFKGKIKVLENKKIKESLQFHFETQEFSIDQVVMNNFKTLKFSECEKRELSAVHRQIIKQYQNLKKSEISKIAKSLIRSIKSTKSDKITIEASHAGTFICLAAIFSGKLPKNKEICFHLTSSPIRLFPQSFVEDKHAAHAVSVSLNNKQGCWMHQLKSLHQSPNYITIGTTPSFNDHLLAG